ncbi:50S ribosomal protein L35 [Candidatus Parcubacteria bacterium]|jgi:ribosomal protein L35|nr:MAG: 50S ribosomal protein L35 [Candidatus Parcubacteria bacterium]
MKKTKKSVTKRIRVTKNGKVARRPMALGHSRSNKSGTQMGRKKGDRGLSLPMSTIKKYI